jgi:hypothetical protein
MATSTPPALEVATGDASEQEAASPSTDDMMTPVVVGGLPEPMAA